MVAQSRSSETFVALCLLTVVGASLCTAELGMSDTLGSFIAGVLLSETSFRTQVRPGGSEAERTTCRRADLIPRRADLPAHPASPRLTPPLHPAPTPQPKVEADIRPFRGLLLGLFFVSVGSSINMDVLRDEWEVVAWMLAGLVSFKAAVNIALGPLFGLTRCAGRARTAAGGGALGRLRATAYGSAAELLLPPPTTSTLALPPPPTPLCSGESIRTGFMLAQGGEFAFVLLSLACQLELLPQQLNQILIIVVVLSMALTPTLAEAGKWLAKETDARWPEGGAAAGGGSPGASPMDGELAADDPVVILGFGPQGQVGGG
jgi:Kef-type K+ transport system membrane component KefB